MKIVVGLSGGVDSSVAAYLLKEQGYDVIGVFMRNWNDASVTLEDECPWIQDSNDALLVAQKLGIPFQVVDFSEVYYKRIVEYMFREYEKGRTPNPDVLCNREIKFDVFLDLALKLGAEKVATGHYARVVERDGKFHLLSGIDGNKDQSYFLCQITQEQLSKANFPIGELKKSEVREIAKKVGLATAEKKDSQGLCFIGKVKLPDFLRQKLKPKIGDIIKIPDDEESFSNAVHENLSKYEQLLILSSPHNLSPSMGDKVGEHHGAYYFTIGQRKGLRVGGQKEPLFVLQTDVENNIVYVGEGQNHKGLHRTVLRMNKDEVNILQPQFFPKFGEYVDVLARTRYRQPLISARLWNFADDVFLEFSQPVNAITPGQFAAWYMGEELIGSGVIAE